MIYINRGTIPKIPDTNDTDIYAEVDTGLVSLRQHNTERHSKREQDIADA